MKTSTPKSSKKLSIKDLIKELGEATVYRILIRYYNKKHSSKVVLRVGADDNNRSKKVSANQRLSASEIDLELLKKSLFR